MKIKESLMPWVTKRSLLISTTLIALLLWRVPGLAAEGDRSVDASMGIAPDGVHDMITATASREGVDPALVKAIVAVESDFKPRAISRKGAKGLMQLMPETASRYGVSNPFDPQANLTGGIRHLRDLLRYFSGNLPWALAAYNAGATAVLMYQGIPPYEETRKYVQKVLARYRPTEVPPSPAPDSSIGRQASEVAQVGEEARAQVIKRDDASPAANEISPESAARLTRMDVRHPLTEISRTALVQMREARITWLRSAPPSQW
jgi:transglycosylase-like protein with SLT domain